MADAPKTVKIASNMQVAAVIGSLEDADGTGNNFETEGTLGDTPDLTIDLTCSLGIDIHKFLLTDVKYYMNPTNAETYELYLFEAASADNVENLADIVFDSDAAQVDSTPYIHISGSGKLPIICNLGTKNKLYYLMVWTGAPGNTPGYIKIRGKPLT